ncbi:hypothetical protein [Radiobacillus sp. PE A8.2]|uniref:hypothetical protein n=1 Tax=Radiobacillus sp. PE A8.2 TaxID=3380349 RepID=UPI00388D728B
MSIHTCSDYDIVRKLKQQERTISQLVEIIAVTNKKVADLSSKYADVEAKTKLHSESLPKHVPIQEPSSSSLVPHPNE